MGGPFCVYLSSRDDAADASEISLASSLKLVRARSDKQVKASLKSMLEILAILIALVGSIMVGYAIQRTILQLVLWFMGRMS